MAKCERCDKELREAGVLPTLELKALGLYPSDRMTLQGDKRTMIVSSGAGTIAVGQSFAEVGTVAIAFTQDQPFQPTSLHRLPGRPINAYPILKDICIVPRVTAGTLATPFTLVGFLKFRDASQSKEHVIMPVSLSVPTAFAATDSSLRAVTNQTSGIYIFAGNVGESPIALFGTWVLEGYLSLGTATTIAFDIFANIGVLYGAPNT